LTLLMLVPLLFLQAEAAEDSPKDSLVVPVIQPVTNVIAKDVPYDEGEKISVSWKLSPDNAKIESYVVYRIAEGENPLQIAELAPGIDSICDKNDLANQRIKYYENSIKAIKRELRKMQRRGKNTDTIQNDLSNMKKELTAARKTLLKNNVNYRYQVVAKVDTFEFQSKLSNQAMAKPQWFHAKRINILIAMLTFFFLVMLFISQAKQGKELFLRKIAGLEAIDEAVGRATEMGRPILFVPGLSDISDIATIAALNILTGIAKKAAQYDTPIIVPNRDPIVYTVAREIVKEAYSDVGRPDAFNPDSVFYVTANQFAYVAAVNGIMLREKPATNFFLGMFWAESLLLAETGNIAGAIQIAGTDASAQLPFFITACDYTIIGEELYAASAYLSHEPNLLGTIKAQDYGKVIIAGLLIVLSLIALFGLPSIVEIMKTV